MKETAWKYTLMGLLLVCVSLWLGIFQTKGDELLIVACDVGQGDAVIVKRGDFEILVDGGPPNGKVLDCLSSFLPFYDKKLEVVVISHPQLDHYGGLIDVFKAYQVETLIVSELDSSSQEYQVLKNVVGSSGVKVVVPDKGLVIRSGMIELEIVHPSRQFVEENTTLAAEESDGVVLGARTGAKDPNGFSVVFELRYGKFNALFTGDIGPKLSDLIAETLAASGVERVDYLKVPHHGSKNGLTQALLEATSPEIAVISVGKNPWGHPHQEILDLLREAGIQVLRTDEKGNAVVETDGEKVFVD